jgi:hypothetical protein
MPQIRTLTYQNSFFPQSIKNWNELSKIDRDIGTISTFKETKIRDLDLRLIICTIYILQGLLPIIPE